LPEGAPHAHVDVVEGTSGSDPVASIAFGQTRAGGPLRALRCKSDEKRGARSRVERTIVTARALRLWSGDPGDFSRRARRSAGTAQTVQTVQTVQTRTDGAERVDRGWSRERRAGSAAAD
jgi:hypothetical protein